MRTLRTDPAGARPATAKDRIGYWALNTLLLIAMGVTFLAMEHFARRPRGSEDVFLRVTLAAVLILAAGLGFMVTRGQPALPIVTAGLFAYGLWDSADPARRAAFAFLVGLGHVMVLAWSAVPGLMRRTVTTTAAWTTVLMMLVFPPWGVRDCVYILMSPGCGSRFAGFSTWLEPPRGVQAFDHPAFYVERGQLLLQLIGVAAAAAIATRRLPGRERSSPPTSRAWRRVARLAVLAIGAAGVIHTLALPPWDLPFWNGDSTFCGYAGWASPPRWPDGDFARVALLRLVLELAAVVVLALAGLALVRSLRRAAV